MEYWLYFLGHGQGWDIKPYKEDSLSTIDLTILISNKTPILKKKIEYIKNSTNPLVKWLSLRNEKDLLLINNLKIEDLNPNIYFNTPTAQRWLSLMHPNLFASWVTRDPLNTWDMQALHSVFSRNYYNFNDNIIDLFIRKLPLKIITIILRKEQKDWLDRPVMLSNLIIINPNQLPYESLEIIATECPFLLFRNLHVDSKIVDKQLVFKWLTAVQQQMHNYKEEHFIVMLPEVVKILDSKYKNEKHTFKPIIQTVKSLYENPQEQAKVFLLNFNRVEAELQSTPMPADTYDYKQLTLTSQVQAIGGQT